MIECMKGILIKIAVTCVLWTVFAGLLGMWLSWLLWGRHKGGDG